MLLTQQEPLSANELTFLLNDERYLLVTKRNVKGGEGAITSRSWEDDPAPDQEAEPKPFRIPIPSFHQGSGFSYANLPGVYATAHQFDAVSPGRASSWARHSVGTTQTYGSSNRRFTISHGGYVYVFGGRYSVKHVTSTTPGTTWTQGEVKDWGAGNYCPGAPVQWNGLLYVPFADAAGLIVWQELTTVATPPATDTWNAGPAGQEARCFEVFQEKLAKADATNGVKTCSTTPRTSGNWSASTSVGDPGVPITELRTADQYLFVGKRDGLWSIDANAFTRNELNDIRRVSDADNCIGMSSWGGGSQLLVPHKQGLIRFRPGRWRFIGPEQEGGLEGDLETGWGRPLATIGYGPMAFAAYKDEQNSAGMIVSYQQPKGEGRGPYIPHAHYVVSSGWFDSLEIHQDSSTGNLYLCATFTSSGTPTQSTLYTWRLPSSAMTVANDPRTVKAVTSDAYLKTARYWQPSRAVQKTFRAVDLYAELSGGDADEGLQVWASVDGGSQFQLLDGSAAAKTVNTTGFHRFFFPKTTAAGGKYVQLEFRLESGGTSVTCSALRDITIHGFYHPVITRLIKALVYLGGGEAEDGLPDRRTFAKAESDLRALAGYASTMSVPTKVYLCHTPWDEDIYVSVARVSVKEIQYRLDKPPIKVAEVVLIEELFS